MLTSLASEIILLILDHLPNRALFSLRATCKALLYIVTPRVFSDFHFDLSRYPLQVHQLQTLSNPSCTIAPHVINLHIASLHIAGYSQDEESEYSQDDTLASLIRIISQHLASSISKLCNLETVR
jgi:F-box domain